MRRTRLVAAAFAGSVCLATLAPVAAASEPTAEVSPRRARPGGQVTLTVACPKHDEPVRHITAYSQAFEDGEADLKLLPQGGRAGQPTYRGTARIASAHHGTGPVRSGWRGPDDGYGSSSGSSGPERPYDPWAGYASAGPYSADEPYQPYDSDAREGDYGADAPSGHRPSPDGKRYGINGSCPDGSDFTAEVVVERKPRGGAHAGEGGSRGRTNVAAVAAGGALVSATVGFGVHALRRRRSEA